MAGLSLGIDLGGTNVRAALVDRDSGRIVASRKARLSSREPQSVAAVVAAAAREAAAEAGTDPARLHGAGVGVAGQCLGSSGVVLNAPNLGWRDVPFGAMLARALGVEARVANDLSAAAWGELHFGAARGFSEVLVVFVGSGVGSGLVVRGKLVEGARGVAGEIGHVRVAPPRGGAPRRCGCGQMGCLEAWAGGMNLSTRVREDLVAGARTAVRDVVGGDLGRVSPAAVEQAFARGDAYARDLWEEIGDLLGTVVANAVTLLNPARLILGGGVLMGCPGLLESTRRHLDAAVSPSAAVGLSVAQAALGDDAGLVGAALLER
ncbi:MAG TPA: ROK family protein [Anaeromyxobacteraceae bacterium]|nr:ROK family protein [Anaeromyxobacteraceae bacterium]